ncbi:nucleocapsid protein [Fusarium sibiricum coguvirus 1]|nr:nucleocapsid protein [Fusarium sibiricum coguvirus 1]
MASTDDFFDTFLGDMSKEQDVLADAATVLDANQLSSLKKRIENKKIKDGKKKAVDIASTAGSFDIIETPAKAADPVITQKAIDDFWKELEKLDLTSLISDDVLNAFKYIGFDPDIVLREILIKGRKAGKNAKQIQKDMVDMVTIAIIKGSITEKNLGKTSDEGKVLYEQLKKIYDLNTGGTKGKTSEYLTIARVAAAVPGMVMQVLIKKPEFAKVFIGPFGSKSLPSYLRHQAAAACIPETAPEKLKEFLFGLITAYTADQSKVLSKTKDAPEVIFDDQLNYVMTTHGSNHPSEEQRKKIFKLFSLSNDYEKLQVVGARIKKIKTDFAILSQQELDEELSKL